MQETKLKTLQITTIDLTAYCFLRTWFRFLENNGFDVTLATTVDEFREELEKTGANVRHVHISRSVNPISDLVSLYNLYKLMKNEKFDLVQTYTTKAGFIGRLAARLAGVPLVIHTMYEPPHNSARNPLLKMLYIWMERFAATLAEHVITISTPNVEEIIDKKIVPEDKLSLIPVGLDLEIYGNIDVDRKEKLQELGIPEEAFFVFTIARLETMKGHVYLMKAAKEILIDHPDTYFICAGRGHLKESLEKKAEEMGIERRFKFPGFRWDVLKLLKCCDLFVLPSLWEGQGVAIMEAMVLKKPVVASRVGGVKDVVKDEPGRKTGRLAPPADSEELKKAILDFIENPERREKIALAGYEDIRNRYDENEFCKMKLKLIKQLMKKVD